MIIKKYRAAVDAAKSILIDESLGFLSTHLHPTRCGVRVDRVEVGEDFWTMEGPLVDILDRDGDYYGREDILEVVNWCQHEKRYNFSWRPDITKRDEKILAKIGDFLDEVCDEVEFIWIGA